MSSLNVPLGILQRISEFLSELPEDQLADLAEGRARITYFPDGSPDPAPRRRPSAARVPTPASAPAPETLELISQLEATASREDAAYEVAALPKVELVAAAKVLSVPRISKLNLADLRAEIVEATVGRRLDSIAIRGFEGDRP